ncbi:YaeQ family protein [Cellvibrio polysaccharolyticus]|uniref:Cellulose synthase n=1 Tax=Cellvibrio polysaccharolyticus TaxID=2082724 RepID=A0A928V779_9GAMM|nr:YaeQ family protein [Cellvibrio polysaccharolyticus]MBE8717349.1 cellulose synthase [Cellvibrio polysaccharolyticus]
MAEKATIYKANITLSDTDRHYYDDLNLTLALHPSETFERMVVRLLAFCFNATARPVFNKGLSSPEEPELWCKSDDGRILNWIEVGQPSVDRLKKASSQSVAVEVFAYGRGMDIWWQQQRDAISAMPKVTMHYFAAEELQALVALVEKNMQWAVTISESLVYVSSGDATVSISLLEMP